MSHRKRTGSSNSPNSWNDDGLDAPGGRPDSRQSSGGFENRNLAIEDDDIMPSAMESEVYVDGEIQIVGQERHRSKPKRVTGFQKFKKGLRCKLYIQY